MYLIYISITEKDQIDSTITTYYVHSCIYYEHGSYSIPYYTLFIGKIFYD